MSPWITAADHTPAMSPSTNTSQPNQYRSFAPGSRRE
jgi:hypothetical protein